MTPDGKPLLESIRELTMWRRIHLRARLRDRIKRELGTTDWEERPIDRKADKEEAEAKRERLADIDGETA